MSINSIRRTNIDVTARGAINSFGRSRIIFQFKPHLYRKVKFSNELFDKSNGTDNEITHLVIR